MAAVAFTFTVAPLASAQTLLRVSPGPLAKAHAELDRLTQCSRCHEADGVATDRCLSCHKPVAERIARKKGVHRAVTNDCVACHTEHVGVDADLRRIDRRAFNHAVETGYRLDGRHAATAEDCSSCHKTRSFLDASPACGSCHTDVHKGSLGPGTDCERCHSTYVPFKETRRQFDHTKTQFMLTGSHLAVGCEKCHAAGAFKGLQFKTCNSCHKEHRTVLGPQCTTCHTTERWTTRTLDHTKTDFALVGAHTEVACAKCHEGGITKPRRSDQCSACHVNVHKESVKEDCRTCHNERRFRDAVPFDHATRTAFPLEGKHVGVTCRKCHTGISAPEVPLSEKLVDFSGATTECSSCHGDKDPHKGEFGRICDSCHRSDTFDAKSFKHPGAADFYAGQHDAVKCEKCHVRGTSLQPVRTAAPPLAAAARATATIRRPAGRVTFPSRECASCHKDVHLGQVGAACEGCHAVAGARFAAVSFSHVRTPFTLTGKHQRLDCIKCHPEEKAVFPAGTGTAKRYNPVSHECRVCHADVHLGQVDSTCSSCHSTTSFKLLVFTHRGLDDLFGGFHGRVGCAGCHKVETGQFPAGPGKALRLKVGRTCASCHPKY